MFPRIDFDFSELLTDQTVNKLALHWGVPKKVLRAFIGGYSYEHFPKIICSGCGRGRATRQGLLSARAQSLPKLVVRVDFSPWGMHAGLHLGVEKGWFKEAGLDVEVSDGKGTGIVLPQVASGDVDVGWVQLGAMAVARGKGIPVTSIAGLARDAATSARWCRKAPA